jgi:hypothetical protein
MKIIISKCTECPCCNYDNERGRDTCNLSDEIFYGFDEMPDDKVHEKCPLKVDSVELILKDE